MPAPVSTHKLCFDSTKRIRSQKQKREVEASATSPRCWTEQRVANVVDVDVVGHLFSFSFWRRREAVPEDGQTWRPPPPASPAAHTAARTAERITPFSRRGRSRNQTCLLKAFSQHFHTGNSHNPAGKSAETAGAGRVVRTAARVNAHNIGESPRFTLRPHTHPKSRRLGAVLRTAELIYLKSERQGRQA